MHYQEAFFKRLNFHLEDEQTIIFDDHKHIYDVVNKLFIHKTKFFTWMDANKKFSEEKVLSYAQFPLKIVWKDFQHEWSPYKIGISIGRVHFTLPRSGEISYLRRLLIISKIIHFMMISK